MGNILSSDDLHNLFTNHSTALGIALPWAGRDQEAKKDMNYIMNHDSNFSTFRAWRFASLW